MPVVVLVALLLANLTSSGGSRPGAAGSGAPLAPVTVAAPPSSPAAQAPCRKLLQALPLRLDGMDPRQVVSDPSSPFVVGWGDPAVTLRCGVQRPADLHPGSSAQFIQIGQANGTGGVYFDVVSSGHNQLYTTVDRSVYVEVSVPSQYAAGPVTTLAGVIARTLPPVCVGAVTPGMTDTSKLCAERP